MPRIIVIQHSPYEPLGIIINTLRKERLRIRYVNFHREPQKRVDVIGYDGLIVLGGSMNPDELNRYSHLSFEIKMIEQALGANIPVLGICLGSQLLNLAIGGTCYRMQQAEFGWTSLHKRIEHPAFSAFSQRAKVFQWHQYASHPPSGVEIVLENEYGVQGFCYNHNSVGLQFHLEIDAPLIRRWLEHPDYLTHLKAHLDASDIDKIKRDTETQLMQSMALGRNFFQQYCTQFNKRKFSLTSMHAEKDPPTA